MRQYLLAGFILLNGCASDVEFTVRPHLTSVNLIVIYHDTLESLRKACNWSKAGACVSHIGRYNGDTVYFHTMKPETFNDEVACRAGHEIWHSLGAKHRNP